MQRPAYQWYPGDFRRDMALQACSWEARSLWRDLLDIMHDCQPYGHLAINGQPLALETVSKMIGLAVSRIRRYLAELEAAGVPSRTEGGLLFSRRMVKDEQIRQARANGGYKSQDNPNVPKKKKGYPPHKKKGYPPDHPSPEREEGSSVGPLGDPLQSASAAAVLPTPFLGVGARWTVRLARVFEKFIGHAEPGEVGKYFADPVKTHGVDAVERGLTAWATEASLHEKPQFLTPKSAARQIATYIRKSQPVEVYDKSGEPTPEFLDAVGRNR